MYTLGPFMRKPIPLIEKAHELSQVIILYSVTTQHGGGVALYQIMHEPYVESRSS